jgi:hypothetical protein
MMAIMVALELERHLKGEHLRYILENDGLKREWIAIGDSKAGLVWLEVSYLSWLEERIEATTDHTFRKVLNFVKAMNEYELFRLAVRTGDAIMIEELYSKFLPIFLLTGKSHYFEIGLSSIEQIYGKIPFKVLQMMRANCCHPLYSGNDKRGNPMAN